jgi:hypothetical protein
VINALILTASFAVATIQLVRSNRQKEAERAIAGLNTTAAIMLVISLVGFFLGITKEVKAARQQSAQTDLIKETNARLAQIEARLPAGAEKSAVTQIRSALSARGSNVSKSDLRESDFLPVRFRSQQFHGS